MWYLWRFPDSTAEDSTAELNLTTTVLRSFSQNADSTAEPEKYGPYGGFLVKTQINKTQINKTII